MIDYTEIDSGLKTLLSPLTKTHGVKTLESYGGEFRDLQEYVNSGLIIPAVMICIVGFNFDDPVKQIERDYDIKIYCCSHDASGRLGATKGAYLLLKGVRDLINRKNIEGGSNPILLKGEKMESYSNEFKLCLYSGNYTIKMR